MSAAAGTGHQLHGGSLPVAHSSLCVVYEGASGRIRHVHHSLTLEGGHQPTRAEVEHEVTEMLEVEHVSMDGMHMLHVPSTSMRPGVAYTVDHASRSLVERRSTPQP